uniref:Biotin--protein ligase n=2 Tax=Schistocephalus solidus TaxID=70667 RepID=A0A0X3PMJ2_SCHSO
MLHMVPSMDPRVFRRVGATFSNPILRLLCSSSPRTSTPAAAPPKHIRPQLYTKPPNIYCHLPPENVFKGRERRCLDQLLPHIRAIADPDVYTVYRLPVEDFTSDVWQASTELLVLCETAAAVSTAKTSAINLSGEDRLINYLTENGKVLLILTGEEEEEEENCKTGKHDKPTLGALEHHVRSSDYSGLPLIATVSASGAKDTGLWTWDLLRPEPGENAVSAKPLLSLYIGPREVHGEEPAKSPPSMLVVRLKDLDALCLRTVLKALGIRTSPPGAAVNGIEQPGQPPKPTDYYAYSLNSPTGDMFTQLRSLLPSPTQKFIVLRSLAEAPAQFAWTDYLVNLKTTVLGRSLVWADVLGSSFTDCQRIQPHLARNSGLLLVSSVQTAGKGRRENCWISPRGMACFSLHTSLPLFDSKQPATVTGSGHQPLELSHYLSWLQHLCALSVVLALRQLTAEAIGIPWHPSPAAKADLGNQLEDCHLLSRLRLPGGVNIGIKWPNDVYLVATADVSGPRGEGILGTRFNKLCGILASGSFSSPKLASCICGIGINVANKKPTTCLHDVIRNLAAFSSPSASSTPSLPSEAAVIARTVSYLEQLIRVLETKGLSGLHEVRELYTACWIHNNQKVRIHQPDSSSTSSSSTHSIEFTLTGLDEFGYLVVVDSEGHQEVLHPNGNSIDMLAGLVIPRHHG